MFPPPHMLILMHQHIKNVPRKLMSILLKLSPKILAHRRKIKTLKTKDTSTSCLWSTAISVLRHEIFIFFLLNSKSTHETCNQGSSGQWQLTLGLAHESVSKAPLFSDSPLSYKQPHQAHFFPILFLGN